MDDTLTRTLSPPTGDMSGALSPYKLLTQASSLPCSSGAATFLSLAPSESQRFPLALDILLPVLQDRAVQPSHRILAAYVLHALYASHDHLNPFHDRLFHIFDSERTVVEAHIRSFHTPTSSEMLPEGVAGVQGENEQLVWVLWKILKGEGEDLAPYSPDILSRAALPEHLRAARLILQSPQAPTQHTNTNPQYRFASRHSLFDSRSTSTSSPAHLPYHERDSSLAHSWSPADSIARPSPVSNRTQFASTLLSHGPENIRHPSEGRTVTNQWHREADLQDFPHDGPRMYFNLQSRPEADSMRSQRNIAPAHEASPPSVSATGDPRQEALLYALLVEPPTEGDFQPRGGSEAPIHFKANSSESNDRSKEIFGAAREPRPSLGFVPDLSPGLRGPLMQQAPTQYSPTSPISPRYQRQSSTVHTNGSSLPGRQFDTSASPFHTAMPSSNNTISRSQLGPIARPKASPSLFFNSTSPEVAPVRENGLNLQRLPSQTYSHAAGFSPVDRSLQQSAQAVPTGGSMQSPGVIGSGRPSTKSISPVGSDAGERERRAEFGVIGNGRPRRIDATPGMTHRSSKGPEQRMEETTKPNFGAIGRPNGGSHEVEEQLTGRKELLVIDKSLTQTSSQRITKETSFHGDSQEFMDSTPPSELSRHEAPSKTRLLRVNTPSSNSSLTEEAPRTHSPIYALTSSLNQLSIPPPSSSPMNVETKLASQLGNRQKSPVCAEEMNTHTPQEIDEGERDELSRAIVLLLSARERVLTLAEQRLLMPHLSMLTRPLSVLRPDDLHPLVAKNPEIAAKLLVLLLDRDDGDGAKIERTLRKVSKHDMFRSEFAQSSPGNPSSTKVNAVDAVQNVLQFVTGGTLSGSAQQDKISPFGGREAKEGYLEALRRLPPTMQSFNVIARLLRPVPSSVSNASGDQETPEGRVARLIRSEVLGGLVSGCVRWIEEAEQGERDGEVLDDRVAVSVSSLSRFYTSLLKHGFASAESEVDTTEIMSFALQFSRFEEARSLYSMLAAARA